MRSDCDPANTRHLPLEWLKPIIKDQKKGQESDIDLPSFVDLQRKTFQTLYGIGGDDKSPKGSVDGPIKPLVDLINKHSSFCTLSSCSGRISLFDPNSRHNDEQEANTESKGTEGSGKGAGGWLLVSHHPIIAHELIECFTQSKNQQNKDDNETITAMPWILKLEPMLLHVAARSLKRGKELLQLSLELGFRESGLVVSDSRVTVAIRTHSLALSIPLSPSGTLRPTEGFLHGLVEQANQRLMKNWQQLDRLYQRIESNFFEISFAPKIQANLIPPLNLWSIAAALTEQDTGEKTGDCNLDVWVFGGYGIGPNKEALGNYGCNRSSHIYKLHRHNNEWSHKWEHVVCQAPSNRTTLNGFNVTWSQKLPACQGMSACFLSKNQFIVLWGGRTSPTKALQELYLFDPTLESYCLAIPTDVHGTAPSPRWGHSMVKINDCTLMVTGGCNVEEGALDDIFLLHVGESTFYWERLSTRLPTPLFHHVTIARDDFILIFGGLQSTIKVLDTFESEDHEKRLWAFKLEKPCKTRDGLIASATSVLKTSKDSASHESLGRFGASACILDSIILVSGGLTGFNDESAPSLEAFYISKDQDMIRATKLLGLCTTEEFDSGSLMHHSFLAVGANEALLLGGGVSSFAFGSTFAK